MFEHFAKKNIQVCSLASVKMQKKILKSLFFQKIKKVKTCSFFKSSEYIVVQHEKLMYFLGLKVTLD